MEGYTARDALIVMRLDLTESLQEIKEEITELRETLEFSGIAEQLLQEGEGEEYPAIKRWLETVGNHQDLKRDLEELTLERDELLSALVHLEERLTGRPR
jgi:hypothetical protein